MPRLLRLPARRDLAVPSTPGRVPALRESGTPWICWERIAWITASGERRIRLCWRVWPLNVCLSSNLALLYRDPAEHPLRRLLDAGVVVTLNRDDPTFLGGLTLTGELRRAAEFAGMSRKALAACQIAAARAAFCTPRERDALVNTLEEFRRTLD